MLTVCHAGNKNRDEYDRRRKNGKYYPLPPYNVTYPNTFVDSSFTFAFFRYKCKVIYGRLGYLLYEMLVSTYLFQDEDWTRFYCRLTGRGERLMPDNAR